MARRRFFVPYVRDGHAEIAGEHARHLTQVLRVETGQVFEISDNSAAYVAEISAVDKTHVTFHVLERLPDPPQEVPVHLVVALFKFDRLELLLEKATELGVTSIQFVRAERSDKGLDQAAEKRMERWRRIVVEASQQSRRLRSPELLPPVRLHEAVAWQPDSCRLFLDEERTGLPLLDAIPQPAKAVSLMIGPEGGWTEQERAMAREAGWTSVSMGTHILRAETAGIAALAVVDAVSHR
ncbi:MAG TPA: RsmE family RNA methyltransferase [Bryobacteraceae bacterium]|nr:RsmE family RNA methyltransferase [Bryobacteraceae bacterium]